MKTVRILILKIILVTEYDKSEWPTNRGRSAPLLLPDVSN